MLARPGGAGSTSSSRLRMSNTPAIFNLLAASNGDGASDARQHDFGPRAHKFMGAEEKPEQQLAMPVAGTLSDYFSLATPRYVN